MKKECKTCGQPTYKYFPYCLDCLNKRNKKLEDIQDLRTNSTDKFPDIINKKENHCNQCGKPSGDFDICYNCYRKKIEDDMKRDIETLIESEKDSGIDIRTKWKAKIRTLNGQYVRSHAECRIADWLAGNNITYEYEKIVYAKGNANKFLLSDFYIPKANIYIEYWGYKDKETYNKRREEKKGIYTDKGLVMRDLEYIHLENLDDSLRQLLVPYFPEL